MECCVRCGGENPSAARFCMTCGFALAEDGRHAPPSRTTLRFVTVLFGDIAGSTELAGRLSPEVWGNVLAAYFAAVSSAAAEHGGRVEKFIGDAVVAVFGAEAAHEDDALRAVDCARTSLERIARQAAELGRTRGVNFSVRFGIASGQAALSGRDSSFAIGEVMNRAARLQAAAPSGGVLIDVRTWLLVRGGVRTVPVEPVVAKGFSRPLRAWRVCDASEGAVEADPAWLPLVDRQPLLDAAADFLRSGLEAPGVPVLVLAGEAGAGKSRFVAELTRRVSDHAQSLILRCRHDGQRLGYWPLYHMAEELAAHCGPSRRMPPVPAGRGPQSKEEIFWTLRTLLKDVTARRPLVLVLDDCQWLPPTVQEFVETLGDVDVPAAIVLCGRVETLALTRRAVTVLRVPPLDLADTRDLAAGVIGRLGLTAGDKLDDLARRSAGNPLYLEQLSHLLLDTESGTDLLPPTAEAAVGARLDRLGGDAQRLLAAANALGGRCAPHDLEMIAEALDPPLDQPFDEVLGQLLEHRLLVLRIGAVEELEVDSPVVADVAYGRLPLADQAAVHARIADLVESRLDLRPSLVELAALHAERAHAAWSELRPEGREERDAAVRMARALCAAAEFAVSRGDLPLALNQTTRAGGLKLNLPGLELEIAAIETYVTAASGRSGETLARIEQARHRWETAANVAAAAHLALNEAVARSMVTGERPEPLLQRARELAGQAGDPAAYARVLLLEGLRHMESGDYVTAEAVLRDALKHGRRARWCFGATEIYGNLGLCLAYGDTPAPEALAICVELRADLNDAHTIRAALGCPAALLMDMTSDAAGSASLLEEAASILSGVGHQPAVAGLEMFRATLRERHGDIDGTARALEEAIRRFDVIGFTPLAKAARLWRSTLGDGTAGHPAASGGWDVEVLAEQAAAAAELHAGRPRKATGHLLRAEARLDRVRGAGARIPPLLVSLRLAARCGDAGLVERIARQAREAAQVKCDARVAQTLDELL